MDNTKNYYNSNNYTVFYNDAISKAQQSGIVIPILGTYTKLVIIYAGHAYRSASLGLNPRANSISGTYYIMSEQFAPYTPYDTEHPNRSFSHIGIHAHELGHLLGFPDLYYSGNNNGYWDLMGSGNYNGPEFAGECPAPISPLLRYDKGWLTVPTNIENVTTNMTNLQLNYSLQSPKVYKVNNSTNSSNYYLFETRSFNSTMQIGSNTCSDYNTYLPHGTQTQGLIVWRRDLSALKGRIVHASGENWPQGGVQGNEGDVFPGLYQRFSIGPTSDTRNPDDQNQNWIPNTKSSTNVAMEMIGIGTNTYTVNLYYSNPPAEGQKSLVQTATLKNGQRKIVQDASSNFHTVFSSGGEIFYRKNVSGTWQNPVKVSYVNGSNDYPSIAYGPSGPMIVWQRNTSSGYYDIYFAMSTDGGATWPSTYKYTLETSVAYTSDPNPVIAMNSGYRKTVLYSSTSGLKSKTSTTYYPTQSNWTSQQVSNFSSDATPSIATVGNSATCVAVYHTNVNNYILYNYQDSQGNWTNYYYSNISQIVPGTAVHQKPTITGVPSSSELHAAWERITNGGVSSYDYTIIHRRANNYTDWRNEYFVTYYQGQQLPSLSGLATNKVDLLFQTTPSFGNIIYKMRFNGTTWGSLTSVASNSVYPSVSIGSTTAKYVYTNGTVSPYTVTLSSETLSKESEFNPEVYSRSIAIMNNPEEYLEVVLNKMYFKMKDGSSQRVDFLPADLEELKTKENFDLTTSNAWDLMKGIKDLTIPVGAVELVFDYTVRGENIDKVIEGNVTNIDLSLGLNVTAKNEKAEKVKSVIINNGKITETKLQEIISLSSLTAERGFDKVDLGLKVKGIVPRSTAFASLGHIFDYTNVAAANETQANKTDNTDGTITEELSTQNYPNPFNPTTLIKFTIKQSGKVTLKVYDVLGREVAELLNTYHGAGSYEIPFDGSNLPSGVYFYNLAANGKSLTKKMMLLK